jgi:hypothetical protein
MPTRHKLANIWLNPRKIAQGRGLFVLDMKDASQVADISEPFFFALSARIEMVRLMSAEDLAASYAVSEAGCGSERDKFFKRTGYTA